MDMSSTQPSSVKLENFTWPELADAIENGVNTVIIPLGATEQHGPHLPLNTDTRLATAIAERVAKRLERTLVAPAIPIGPSTEHAGFPGTISITPKTLERLVQEQVASFAEQGFGRIVLLPGHGGSFPIIETAYPDLVEETDAEIVAITELNRYVNLLKTGLEAAGIDIDEPAPHAGASETAMLLAVAPEAVRDERPTGHTGSVSLAKLFSEGVETYAENGVLGDAREATVEAGKTVLEVLVDGYTEFIRSEFTALDDDLPDDFGHP